MPFELTSDRVEKYRPNTLDEVVSHKDITSTSQSQTAKRQLCLLGSCCEGLTKSLYS